MFESRGKPEWHWLEIDLEESHLLSGLRFWTGHTTGPFPLTDFALQHWTGDAWTDLTAVAGSTNNGFVDLSFGPSLSSNRVRLHITGTADDNIIRLFEVEILGEPHALNYTALEPAPDLPMVDRSSALTVTFNNTVDLVDDTGIRIKNLDTSTDLSGLSASASGQELMVAHPGLSPETRYRVSIPAGVVALAGTPSTINGPITWTFSTASPGPELQGYQPEGTDLAAPIVLPFDRDIAISDANGIRVRRGSDISALPGLSPSVVNGSELHLAHSGLTADEAYIIHLDAGAITETLSSQPNEAIQEIFFAGSTTLFDADFAEGMDGFQTAAMLESIPNSPVPWRRETSIAGPGFDGSYLHNDSKSEPYDYFVSPLIQLETGTQYALSLDYSLRKDLHIGFSPTPNKADVTEVAVINQNFGGNGSQTVQFTSDVTGDFYIVFYDTATQPWQDNYVDSIRMRKSVPPVLQILSPASGSTFLETDTIPIEIEAYGITSAIEQVQIFDDDKLLATPAGSLGTYLYPWSGHVPGIRTLKAVVTDEQGSVVESSIPLTITLEDGSLDPFLHWDFDDNLQGWSLSVGGSKLRRQNGAIRSNSPASDRLALSSPKVSLLAGEIYTLQWQTRRWGTSNSFTWAFLPTATTGFPVDQTGSTSFSINTDSWKDNEITFSVAQDGAYHLTFFHPSTSGYIKVDFDDVRLLGNFNSVPQVSLSQPSGAVTTLAKSTVILTAEASDSDGTVSEVRFLDANTGDLIAPDAIATEAPWTYEWTPSAPGEFQVYAEAIDDQNGSGVSPSRAVTVAPNQYSISTYLGEAADDEAFTGAVYLSDGTLVVSGIINPALFPGSVSPTYLNGSSSGDRGVVVRLSGDGQNVLSLTVVGARALDIDTDGSDRIFVAAGSDGVVVLNSTASSVLWSNDYGAPHVHRVDAAEGGTFAVLTSSSFDFLDERIATGTNYIYDTNFVELGSMGGAAAFTTDLAVDEASETVIFIGWKNIVSMGPPPGESGINPVDIPSMVGRSFDGTVLRFRAYDWENDDSGARHLNYVKNNMADTRGSRVIIGSDGYLYAGIEFDGGNTPLRDDPFDLTVSALDRIVGGDNFHSMSNTSTVPKTFVGRFDPASGALIQGQWITNRVGDGDDNTIRIKNGNLHVDEAGRIHVVGGSASGLPLTHDPLSGINYTGGAFHLVYSPDFTSREYVTRLTLTSGDGMGVIAGVAVAPDGTVATAGLTHSPFLFDSNAWQQELTGGSDGFLAVAQTEDYYQFQTGVHPRLFFDSAELAEIRLRLDREPYASMLDRLVQVRDFPDFYRPHDPSNEGNLRIRAAISAYLYALTGEESYALDSRQDMQAAWDLAGEDWASSSQKGLTLYDQAMKLAISYDLCATSTSWDAGFNYEASRRLVELAQVILEDGGTEQPDDLGSNWAAGRGASAGMALLATDHTYDAAWVSTAHNRTINYLNTNQGTSATKGWNPEGFGYTAYALGTFLGPYAIAAERNGIGDLPTHRGLQWMPWTGFAGATTALDVYSLGGVKTDWSDDNAHVGGEGIYGMAFAFAPPSLVPGLKYAYDRFMGELSPFGADWDGVRGGTFWSILYYPESVPAQNPTEIWDWHRASDDSQGLGMMTFRNQYEGPDDILVQFKAKLRNLTQAHDGPDGLGFRVIGLDDPFVIGGGRTQSTGKRSQATVYPVNPDSDLGTNRNTGSLIGTPLIKPDGGGHAIASMSNSNVGTSNHKRWLVTDFDQANTGADAVIIVADTSTNGLYWQLPTFLSNTVNHSGNTFTITGSDGATLKGTILHPGGTPTIETGIHARGSGYTLQNGGELSTEDPVTNPRIEENRYLRIRNDGDGDFLVVLTLVKSGSHPQVTHLGGNVADALIQVGTQKYALQSDDVLYAVGGGTPAAYSPTNASITFDADGKGSLTGAPAQSIAYGGSATAPDVTPNPGYTFIGWDKAFDQVVRDMTVTALYESTTTSGTFEAWIQEELAGYTPAEQAAGADPDQDGIANLIEYALVLNPDSPDRAGLPSAQTDGSDFVISYRLRNPPTGFVAGLTSTPSLDPASWSGVPAEMISVTGSGPGYTTYEARVPISEGGSGFFQLVVAESP